MHVCNSESPTCVSSTISPHRQIHLPKSISHKKYQIISLTYLFGYHLVKFTRLSFPAHSIRAHCSEAVEIDCTRGTFRDKRCVGHFHYFSADVMTPTRMAPIPPFLLRIPAIARFRLQRNHIILNRQTCPASYLSKPFTVGPIRSSTPHNRYR